ncbi:hypothetical protein JAAARDRAFT_32699 [Jaapia argillacea MUCL 33604]|uniref:F-box domain-containing protein n=1 Tax=Jaapia argillacea MUCL 33604 TaxID=933084 RepID=A0A067Q9X3_9AGAM|nr:hypothetical protein JAAARDRAFT_32699 [Jaapia argillacea MUCL 33604]
MAELPVELCARIFRLLGANDLTSLSRVSQAFQTEAEHLLYQSVALSKISESSRLLSWCNAVAHCERRAARVNTLRFPTVFKLPPQETSTDLTHTSISQAFKAMVNLKALYVESAERGVEFHPSLRPSTFDNCEFRLVELVGDLPGFTVDEIWTLLSSQPDIHYWVPGQAFTMSLDVSSFPPDVLPQLRDLLFIRPGLTKHLAGRPIRRLSWLFYLQETQIIGLPQSISIAQATIPDLRLFRDTLSELYIMNHLEEGFSVLEVVALVAEYAPRLRTLTIRSEGSDCAIPEVEHSQLVQAISSFKQLDTLALEVEMLVLHLFNNTPISSDDPLEQDPFWSGLSPVHCREVATSLMVSCPSLRTVSFPLQNPSGTSKNPCYTRTVNGEAKLVGFDLVDTTSWWMK